MKTPDGKTHYYLTDDPGNVIGLLNGSNQVVNWYKYQPFGGNQGAGGTLAQPLGYAGAVREGSLYYFRNRWYDPYLERFMSEDPIGLAGGINPYTFVGNSPMEGRDPSGLDHCTALQESLNKSDGSHGCGGTPVSLPGISNSNGSWNFSTPRNQGTSANFGNRGNGLGSPTSFANYAGYGNGSGAQPIPQPVLGTFLHDPRLTPQTCSRRLGFTTTGRTRIRTHRGRIAINSATWDLNPVEEHRKYFFGLIGPIVRVEYVGDVTARGPSAVAELPATAGADCVAGDVYATGWDVF